VQHAGKIYRHIEMKNGTENFIAEVSMDETDAPQTPPELLVILAAIADEKIPAQTIAAEIRRALQQGRGLRGDLVQFEKEFHDDLAVIAYAIRTLRPARESQTQRPTAQRRFRSTRSSGTRCRIRRGAAHQDAGTTWLEELIGLAEAGGDALALAKENLHRRDRPRG